MKKPIGSQFSFSNLDGARASISSEDRLSISFERQEAVEVGEEEEIKEEKELNEEEKMWNEWMRKKYGWEWSGWEEYVKMKEEKEEEEEEEKSEININDPTSTLGPSRDPTDPSASGVTAEPIDPNRCLRPLQRARERRAARLKEESHADAEFDPDPHVPSAKPGSQKSSVLSAWEQERVHPRCDRCNNKLTDSDWSKIKSKGWDVEIVKHAPFCSSCIDQWRVL